MIDLARKESEYATASPEPSKKVKVYYPTLHISSDETFEVPTGAFMAKVKLKKTGATESEDENGKKRYSCTYDVMGMEPGKCCEDEEKEKEEPEDAVTSMTKAMKSAKNKKLMGDE